MPAGSRGFTLIELLVVISIFSIVSLSLLSNYPQFRSSISLKRTAQEIALSIRQAQVYGLSVTEFGAGSGIFPGYGVHFDINTPSVFILFADANNNKLYDGTSEELQTFRIQTADRISKLCGNEKTAPPGDCALSQLDVVYLRPGPNVVLMSGAVEFSDAEVIVRSSGGEEKTVVVWLTGQIAVE